MNILKPNLKWARPLSPFRLNEIDGIALHHSDHSTADIQKIHEWHLDKGWAGCGYHYFIDKQGRVWEGRGLNYGAHTADHNSHLFGVCFQGDYDGLDKIMPEVQFKAGVETCLWLKEKAPTIKYIDGHGFWRPTACPGKYFPLTKMKNYTTGSDAARVAKKLRDRGVTNDEQYWRDVLEGRVAPKPEYLMAIFGRLLL